MGDLGDGTGSSYPAALDTDTNQEVNSPSASKTKARAEVPNDLAAAVIAVQTELGINPAGSLTDVKTFLQAEHDADGTHNDTATSTILETATYLKYNAGLFSRSKFEYIDADTIFIGAGQYWCKDKFAWWDAQLTSANIGTPTASTWVYLYLDYSAITSGTEITNSEILWSEDPPAYSHASRAWLRTSTNTDDRCIFAVYSNASQNITEFFNDGGNYVGFSNDVEDYSLAIINNDWSSQFTVTVPSFCTKLILTHFNTYVDGDATVSWRVDGQTGSTGHLIGRVNVDVVYSVNTSIVNCSTAQVIEVIESGAGTNNQSLFRTVGWYLPIGI